MRKLKLDLDDLAVETFDPRPSRVDRRGTLFGHDGTAHTVCWGLTCPGCDPTQLAFCTAGCASEAQDTHCQTCGGTCPQSCYQTACATCNEQTCDQCGPDTLEAFCTTPEGGC